MTNRESHRTAMQVAQLSTQARREGHYAAARAYADCALRWMTYITNLSPVPESEPTRSIGYRTAATLAWWAGETDTARRFIESGKTEHTPSSVAIEFDELLERLDAGITIEDLSK